MNTVFWGPDGWKLLHYIAYQYSDKPTKKETNQYLAFYKILPKILPCKYCRSSLLDFYREIPIELYINNKEQLTKWIYLIHNKVNEKLRCQGFLNTIDPTKKKVDSYYSKFDEYKNSLVGRNFIYSTIYNFPTMLKNNKSKNNSNSNSNSNLLIRFIKYLSDIYPDCRVKELLNIDSINNNIRNFKNGNIDNQLNIFIKLDCMIGNQNNNNCKIKLKNIKKLLEDNKVKQCQQTCRKKG